MNGLPTGPQSKALEFVNNTSTYALLVTLALLAWVASGVEFANDSFRLVSMLSLALSVVFGIATLALISLVQETSRAGQSNFDVEPQVFFFGRRSLRQKTTLLPQYAFMLLGIILYPGGMVD